MSGLSPKRLARLFAGLDDPVIVSDPGRRIVYANPAAERVFGYTVAELVGAPAQRLYATERDYQRLGQELAGGEPGRPNTRQRVANVRKNGDVFSSEAVTSTVRDEEGGILGYIGIIHDITDRLAVEEEAAVAAATLQDAVETIDEGFALFDPEDRLAVCNERYREVYPKSARSIVPGTPFEVILRTGLEAGEFNLGDKTAEEWLEERLRMHRRADGTRIEQQLGDGRWMQIRERRKAASPASARTSRR